MVILKLTKPVPDEFECEVMNAERKGDFNLVRPCERYMELYKSCKSINNRIHQYYVYGELLDCSVHKNNYTTCLDYRKTRNQKLLTPIIEWEKNLIQTRLMTVAQNKAWEMRESPPKDFDGPLPKFITKRQNGSLFKKL